MANTPIPKVRKPIPPAPPAPPGSPWASAPKVMQDQDPVGVDIKDGGLVDPANIISERPNSQFKGASRWRAGSVDPEHASLRKTNLEELSDESRIKLRDLFERTRPSFHEFINGQVAPNIVSQLLLSAEGIIASESQFESLEHYLGVNAMMDDYISEGEYGVFTLPGDGRAGAMARNLGWDSDAFVEIVRMARIANYEKWVASKEASSIWMTNHMERLYRMLKFLQEKLVFQDADYLLESIFTANGLMDRIAMKDLVCIYGKAAAEDIDFFDLIEVLLNATWGKEPMLVSKASAKNPGKAGTDWYHDRDDHMYVRARLLAETAAAFMYGPNRQIHFSAVNYSILGEQHLHGVGYSQGGYDFFERELCRRDARRDLQRNPELYYDDVDPIIKKSQSWEMNNDRALARLRELFAGSEFEDEAARITDADGFIAPNRALFRNMSLDVSWVDDVEHYARGTLYALLAVARFNQAGEEMIETNPSQARAMFSLARHMLSIYDQRSVVMQYLSGPIRDSVVHLIIQPFDMMKYDELYDRIKMNERKLVARVKPPPRKRRR